MSLLMVECRRSGNMPLRFDQELPPRQRRLPPKACLHAMTEVASLQTPVDRISASEALRSESAAERGSAASGARTRASTGERALLD
eukprot:365148-Chlamydomonas_euryale.AAC.5